MDKLHSALLYVSAHWQAIVTVIGIALSLLGTVKNALGYMKGAKPAEAVTVIDHMIDVLAWVSQNGKRGVLGVLNLPLFPSMPKPAAPEKK